MRELSNRDPVGLVEKQRRRPRTTGARRAAIFSRDRLETRQASSERLARSTRLRHGRRSVRVSRRPARKPARSTKRGDLASFDELLRSGRRRARGRPRRDAMGPARSVAPKQRATCATSRPSAPKSTTMRAPMGPVSRNEAMRRRSAVPRAVSRHDHDGRALAPQRRRTGTYTRASSPHSRRRTASAAAPSARRSARASAPAARERSRRRISRARAARATGDSPSRPTHR